MTDNTKANTTKTREAHDAYLANREEAGRVIDIETCEIRCFWVDYFDPYGTAPFDEDMPTDGSNCWFVRSAESGGWIRGA